VGTPGICLYCFPKEQGSMFLWDVEPTCSVGPTFEKQPHKALLHEPTWWVKMCICLFIRRLEWNTNK